MSRIDAPTMDPASSPATARGRFVLHRVFDGPSRRVVRQAHVLDGDVLLARAEAAPGVVALPDDVRASRRHAVLTVEARTPSGGLQQPAVSIVDESRHGTWVDGAKIDRARMTDGAVLRAGDTIFVLRHEPVDVEDAAVPEVVGASVEARALRATIAQVAPTGATTLLLGATGTGKEVAARALHRASGRRGPLVPVNCGAIPEALFESELFGRTKGAFTGADKDEAGLVRAADGGTLFLDEIGELPLALQPKLLRFLDEGAVLAVGARKAVPVDARVVAATHQDLAKLVASGRFRADLFARLAEIVVPLPPLAQRRDDVLDLVARALGDGAPPLHADLAHALVLHAWPFNVREVMKVGSELKVKGRGRDALELPLVVERLQTTKATAAGSATSALDGAPPPAGSAAGARTRRDDGPTGARRTDDDEADDDDDGGPVPDRAGLEKLLVEHAGVVAEIARATKRSRRQVRRWLEKHGLVAEAYRR